MSQDPDVPARRLSNLALTGVTAGAVIGAVLLLFFVLTRPSAPVLPHPLLSASSPLPSTGPLLAGPAGSGSGWRSLSPGEQAALAPLASEWDQLDSARQRKWLVIADRFPSMPATEQARTQEQMREWVRLTPEQRRVARDTYLRAHAMSSQRRAELLEKYQQLPDEEKEHLAALARSHRSVLPAKAPSQSEHIPNKAQIKEGSTQRVPGLAVAHSTPPAVASPAAPANGNGNATAPATGLPTAGSVTPPPAVPPAASGSAVTNPSNTTSGNAPSSAANSTANSAANSSVASPAALAPNAPVAGPASAIAPSAALPLGAVPAAGASQAPAASTSAHS